MTPEKLGEYVLLLKAISEKTWDETVLGAKKDPKEIFVATQLNNGTIN